MKRYYKPLLLIFILLAIGATLLTACRSNKAARHSTVNEVLADSITKIISDYPGEIGVSVIVDGTDTVEIDLNNTRRYPMMSVFKLHQALAVCDDFARKGISLDTLVSINRDSLNPDTWTPMLKEHPEQVISLSVSDLLRYTLTQSDNNASNYMFKHFANVAQTDSFIATLIPGSDFRIAHTEEEMANDHTKAYHNFTSPLGAAKLIYRLFTDSLIDSNMQRFVMQTLGECTTGNDRIILPLLDIEGASVAHKTGSGYVDHGILAAHNDVAYICLPNGTNYSLAVFVKDFKGNEAQASKAIARISSAVYSVLKDIR